MILEFSVPADADEVGVAVRAFAGAAGAPDFASVGTGGADPGAGFAPLLADVVGAAGAPGFASVAGGEGDPAAVVAVAGAADVPLRLLK